MYYLRISKVGQPWVTVSAMDANRGSQSKWEYVRDEALKAYRGLGDDDAIEITSAGLTIWGPFIKGSTKFIPTGI